MRETKIGKPAIANRNIRDSRTRGMLIHHPARKQLIIGTAPNKKPIVTISIFRIICSFLTS